MKLVNNTIVIKDTIVIYIDDIAGFDNVKSKSFTIIMNNGDNDLDIIGHSLDDLNILFEEYYSTRTQTSI